MPRTLEFQGGEIDGGTITYRSGRIHDHLWFAPRLGVQRDPAVHRYYCPGWGAFSTAPSKVFHTLYVLVREWTREDRPRYCYVWYRSKRSP